MENGEPTVPEFLLDGQVWVTHSKTRHFYVIPTKGEQYWHVVEYSLLDMECSFSKRAVTPYGLSLTFRHYNIDPYSVKWEPSNQYAPSTDGTNPASAPPAPRKPEPGFIYFIRARGRELVKIGWARNPETRCKTLQTGNPFVLILEAIIPNSTQADEAALHKRFDKHHWRGEWFTREGDLAAFIDSLPRGVRRAKSRH